VWVQNCLVTSYHFQPSSHFYNQNTFNLLWLTSFNNEINISCFQNNKETMKRHVSLKDEMWSQNKMQNDKIHNKNDLTGQHPSWISYSGNICVLPSNFNHLPFWGCSMTIWPMKPSFTNSIRLLLTNFRTWSLKFLQLLNWNGRGPHHDITSLIWIIPPRKWWLHGIRQSQAKSLESNRCW